jgi:hypothetical protein
MSVRKAGGNPIVLMDVPSDVACVHCGAKEVEVVSLYGAHPSEMLLKCRKCKTHFGFFKFRAESSL